MPTFDSWSALEKHIRKQVNDVLDKEVANAVKDEIIMSVDEVVYGSGSPLVYERRGLSPNSEGLGGRSQMHHTVSQDGVLEVTDDAEAKNDWDMNLTEAIEYGYSNRETWYNQPRPFMENARENLRDGKYHVERMKEGLEKRGFKVL